MHVSKFTTRRTKLFMLISNQTISRDKYSYKFKN